MTPNKSDITRRKAMFPVAFDDIFESFRRDMEDAFYFPRRIFGRRNELLSEMDGRLPLCDMEDLGDKYEITLETPGIPKDKITIRAGDDYIDISGEQEKKLEEKKKDYLYNERSYSSLKRRLATPEEIVPSKIDAKVENGILRIQAPKKTPTKTEETNVEIK